MTSRLGTGKSVTFFTVHWGQAFLYSEKQVWNLYLVFFSKKSHHKDKSVKFWSYNSIFGLFQLFILNISVSLQEFISVDGYVYWVPLLVTKYVYFRIFFRQESTYLIINCILETINTKQSTNFENEINYLFNFQCFLPRCGTCTITFANNKYWGAEERGKGRANVAV